MKTNNPLTKLPSPSILLNKRGLKKFQTEITPLKENSEDERIKIIAILIDEKINLNKWSAQDYKEFRKLLFSIDNKKFDVLASSIIKCLEVPTIEIYSELKEISKHINWYPTYDRIINENTNKYEYKQKEINKMDCFYIIDNLIRYINKYIFTYAAKLNREYTNVEDIHNILIEKEPEILSDYDNNFKYILDYPLFMDIYLNMRKNIITRLKEQVIFNKNNYTHRKEQKSYWSASENAKRAALGQNKYQKKLARENKFFQNYK